MTLAKRAGDPVKNPHIRTELPGPKSRAMIERDSKVESPSYPRDYPFVMSHARGTEAWDVDGNRFLDFAAACCTAATTLGCACPVEQTAMPAAKSRNRLPSTSQASVPRACDITNG